MTHTYSCRYTTPCEGVKSQNFGQKTAKFLKNSENDGHRQSSKLPFFGQNFGVWHLHRVWYTCQNMHESSESKFITKKLKIITNNPGDSIQHHALLIFWTRLYCFSFRDWNLIWYILNFCFTMILNFRQFWFLGRQNRKAWLLKCSRQGTTSLLLTFEKYGVVIW